MRRMTMLIAPVLLAACQSNQDLCRDEVNQTCERQFNCRDATTKSTQLFITQFGTSVEECKTKLYANPLGPFNQTGVPCDTADTDQEVCTNWSRSTASNVDFGKANECRDTRANLACTDWINQYSNPSLAPAVCGERCR